MEINYITVTLIAAAIIIAAITFMTRKPRSFSSTSTLVLQPVLVFFPEGSSRRSKRTSPSWSRS